MHLRIKHPSLNTSSSTTPPPSSSSSSASSSSSTSSSSSSSSTSGSRQQVSVNTSAVHQMTAPSKPFSLNSLESIITIITFYLFYHLDPVPFEMGTASLSFSLHHNSTSGRNTTTHRHKYQTTTP